MSTAKTRRSRKKTDERSWGSGWQALVNATSSTEANIRVDEMSSMQCSAVYAAVRLLSETVASLPLNVYERLSEGRRVAEDHPVYDALQISPNDLCTPMVFRETMMVHSLLWGNGYAEIVRSPTSDAVELYLVEPWRVTPKIQNGRLVYIVRIGASEDGTITKQRTIDAADMLHIPCLGTNGVVGKSVISWARETIAVSLAADRFGSSFFGKSARPSGVLQHPGHLDEEGANRLRESWQNSYGGSSNVGKVAVLEEGMTFNSISIPPEDAQFLETRQFQVTEIARWFRVPPHMIGDLSHATFSNIEHQGIDFVVHSIRPWLVRLEQEFTRKLLSGPFFCRHNVDELLRGDAATRFQVYATGRQWGIFSVNDCRKMENMNPLPGEQGDIYLIPANMMDAAASPQQQDHQQPPLAASNNARAAHRDSILDAVARMIAIENNSMRRAASKGLAAFAMYSDELAEKQAKRMHEALRPPVRAYLESIGSDQDVDQLLSGVITRHVMDLRSLMAEAHSSESPLESVVDNVISRRELNAANVLTKRLMGD